MYETKENSGSLFRNQKKEKDTHPNLTGSARINGVDYWVSCWSKPTKDGKDKWLSLAFKPKEERQAEPDKGYGDTRIDLDDSDLPF